MTQRILLKRFRARFLKIAKCRGRQRSHKAEASGKKFRREGAGDMHHRAGPTLVDGRSDSDSPCKEIAETAQASKADFHANVGDRMVAFGEQQLSLVETSLNSELMRGKAKNRFKLTDEVELRHTRFAGYVTNGKALIADFG
jgi:hypothetical protein